MSLSTPFRCTRNLLTTMRRKRRLARAEAEAVRAMRGLCLDLIVDLTPSQRAGLTLRIAQAREYDDLWHLRSSLFGAISLEHGERVARERLARFDTRCS